MTLTVVFAVLGQHDMARVAIRQVLDNCMLEDTRVLVVDNGGDFVDKSCDERVTVVRPGKNIGVYPVFRFAFYTSPLAPHSEVLLFLHSDLMVTEKGFDSRVLERFEQNSKLGLLGFIGSNEIEFNGGRGLGTTSNFQGLKYADIEVSIEKLWIGSPAEVHGKRNNGVTRAAVVDGCAMAVRRSAWGTIGYRDDFPPHHFYDRLISTQMLEHGYEIEVLGVACDHISGQTVSKEERYNDIAKEWCDRNGIAPTHNYDDAIYREAERRWLYEFRQVKHIVPVKV